MEKIWIKSYDPGVNYEININKYSSIFDVFVKTLEKYPNNVAYSNFGKDLTFFDVKKLVDIFSSFLQNELHLKKGDKLAIMMPNLLQYPVVLLSAFRLGVIIVNINPLYTPRELEYQLKDSEAETIIIAENCAHTLEVTLSKIDVKNIIITGVGDLLGFLKGNILNFTIKNIKKIIPKYNISNAISFKEALKKGKNKKFSHVDVTLDDIALLQYTGGTTGISKGAILTHGNICANTLQCIECTKNGRHKDPTKESVLTPLPLYHIFAFTANMMLFLAVGSRVILVTNPKDIDGFVKLIKKEEKSITILIGVNSLFNALTYNQKFKDIDFSNWRISLAGGAAVHEPMAKRWEKITNIPIRESYGLTEGSPVVCVNSFIINKFNGKIGLPVPMTDVQVRDDNGNELGIGEAGELYIKGPQVMKGYWKKPEETKKVLTEDGWLATGDIVIIDKDGFIEIVDRKKDMVVISGFNVYPNEIDEVLVSHPKVQEAACIGVPNHITGETLKAYVVKKDDSLTAAELIKYCRENLVSYKVPRKIEFRNDLPKSNVGKVLKRLLRDEKQKDNIENN